MLSRNRYKKSKHALLLWRKVLPTEKYLVTSLWSIFQISLGPFFKFLGNQGELERTETTKNVCWCRGIFL